MKKGPFCAEQIQDEAIVYRYCEREIVFKAAVDILLQLSKPV
jgi:hypothetical protein